MRFSTAGSPLSREGRGQHWLATALACLCLLLLGCEASKEGPAAVGSASASTVSLFSESELNKAVAQIEKTVPAPIEALQLVVHHDHLKLQVRDPKIRSKVVQYTYRNASLSGPVPVRLEGMGELGENLFPLKKVALHKLPKLAKKAIEHVDPAHGKVSYAIIRRNLPFDEDVQFRIFVKSPAKDGYLDATEAGKVIR